MRINFDWISKHKDKEFVQELVDTKKQVFSNDVSRDEELDIFETIFNKGNKDVDYNGKHYNDIDYALIKYRNDETLGFIGYYADNNKNYWLGQFGIVGSYRRFGFGTRALLLLERWLLDNRSVDTLRVYTGIKSNEAAYALYKKLGYVRQSELFAKDEKDDIVIFGKSLVSSTYHFWKGEPFWY